MAYAGVVDDVKTCIKLNLPRRLPVFALSEEFDVRMAGLTYEEYSTDAKNTMFNMTRRLLFLTIRCFIRFILFSLFLRVLV